MSQTWWGIRLTYAGFARSTCGEGLRDGLNRNQTCFEVRARGSEVTVQTRRYAAKHQHLRVQCLWDPVGV